MTNKQLRKAGDNKMKVEIIETTETFKERWGANACGFYCDILADGEVVGNAYGDVYEAEDYAHMERLDVDDEHQNKGIGTQAIKLLVERFGTITLAADSERVAGFYKRLGEETDIESASYRDCGFGVWQIDEYTLR